MRYIFVFIGILIYLGSWQLVEGDPVQQTLAISDSIDINPNGSSELSILMRDMYDHALEARKLALSGKINTTYPVEFDKVHTATPTDGETKNSFYDTFADVYLMSVKNYTTTKVEDLKLNYNNMVNTCLACHSSHCPGPVPRIKKLLIY